MIGCFGFGFNLVYYFIDILGFIFGSNLVMFDFYVCNFFGVMFFYLGLKISFVG